MVPARFNKIEQNGEKTAPALVRFVKCVPSSAHEKGPTGMGP